MYPLALGLAATVGLAAEPDSTADNPDTGKAKALPFSIVNDTELGRSLSATLDACRFDWLGSDKLPAAPPPASLPAGTENPRTIRFPQLQYPFSAERSGQQGAVLIEMLIGVDGYARFVHVTRTLPFREKVGFVEQSILAARRAKFAPARSANLAVAAWKSFKFSYGGSKILNKEAVKKLLKQSAIGDTNSIIALSYLDSIERQGAGFTHEARRDFLAYAALSGERWARADVDRVLRPESCQKPAVVAEYLRATVWQGNSELELMHATQLIERNDPADRRDAGVFLHGAANANDPFVRIWAAGILATAPDAENRDPVVALATVGDMTDDGYPEFQELLAAAAAANGDFATAIRAEQLALSRAREFRWEDVHMRERLTSYQAQRPWTGYLCDCTVLVPGHGN